MDLRKGDVKVPATVEGLKHARDLLAKLLKKERQRVDGLRRELDAVRAELAEYRSEAERRARVAELDGDRP